MTHRLEDQSEVGVREAEQRGLPRLGHRAARDLAVDVAGKIASGPCQQPRLDRQTSERPTTRCSTAASRRTSTGAAPRTPARAGCRCSATLDPPSYDGAASVGRDERSGSARADPCPRGESGRDGSDSAQRDDRHVEPLAPAAAPAARAGTRARAPRRPPRAAGSPRQRRCRRWRARRRRARRGGPDATASDLHLEGGRGRTRGRSSRRARRRAACPACARARSRRPSPTASGAPRMKPRASMPATRSTRPDPCGGERRRDAVDHGRDARAGRRAAA